MFVSFVLEIVRDSSMVNIVYMKCALVIGSKVYVAWKRKMLHDVIGGHQAYIHREVWAILHLFERLFLISWEINRDCHITMPLSLKTMEVQIKGEQ